MSIEETVDPVKDTIKKLNYLIDTHIKKTPEISESRKEEVLGLKDKLKLITDCPCARGEGIILGTPMSKKEKAKREPSERAKFLGQCMRSPEKGGEGKDMKTCSDRWKEEKSKGDTIK